MNEEYVHFFKALSHRSRLRLLELLAEKEELSVTELADSMPREASTISKHLNQLNLHGLVQVRQEGQNRYYSLASENILKTFLAFQKELNINTST